MSDDARAAVQRDSKRPRRVAAAQGAAVAAAPAPAPPAPAPTPAPAAAAALCPAPTDAQLRAAQAAADAAASAAAGSSNVDSPLPSPSAIRPPPLRRLLRLPPVGAAEAHPPRPGQNLAELSPDTLGVLQHGGDEAVQVAREDRAQLMAVVQQQHRTIAGLQQANAGLQSQISLVDQRCAGILDLLGRLMSAQADLTFLLRSHLGLPVTLSAPADGASTRGAPGAGAAPPLALPAPSAPAAGAGAAAGRPAAPASGRARRGTVTAAPAAAPAPAPAVADADADAGAPAAAAQARLAAGDGLESSDGELPVTDLGHLIPSFSKFGTVDNFYAALTIGRPGIYPALRALLAQDEARGGLSKTQVFRIHRASNYIKGLTALLNKYPELMTGNLPAGAITEAQVALQLERWRKDDGGTERKNPTLAGYFDKGLAPLWVRVLRNLGYEDPKVDPAIAKSKPAASALARTVRMERRIDALGER
jgi:hypothetical protein